MSESRQLWFLKDPYHKDRFIYDEQSDSFSAHRDASMRTEFAPGL